MLKRTIKYKDFNDVEREETFYFNLTKAEVAEMEIAAGREGLEEKIRRIIKEEDGEKILNFFKSFILSTIGEKSPDGRRFIKNEALREAFSQTEAYSVLFLELSTDGAAAAAFVNGVIPQPESK